MTPSQKNHESPASANQDALRRRTPETNDLLYDYDDSSILLGDGIIMQDELNVYYGDSGIGKSTLMRNIAAHFAPADPHNSWLPIEERTRTPRVYFFTEEDRRQKQVISLRENGCECATINPPLPTLKKNENLVTTLTRKENIKTMEDLNVKLIVIDPLSQWLKGNLNKDTDVDNWLAPLLQLAHEHHITIALVHHTNKKRSDSNMAYSGSHTIIAKCRYAVSVVAEERTDSKGRNAKMLLARVEKSNDSPTGLTFEMRLDAKHVKHNGREYIVNGDIEKIKDQEEGNMRFNAAWDARFDREKETEEDRSLYGDLWRKTVKPYLETNGGWRLFSEILALCTKESTKYGVQGLTVVHGVQRAAKKQGQLLFLHLQERGPRGVWYLSGMDRAKVIEEVMRNWGGTR
ncbi:AAA domain-containing protein [Pseudoscardovia radai]|uniref:AAA domain-containing protein n=1 Tax=Pseudoscardovia radai TaxID=987066 RepID=A0A261EWG2_9BIFI|nr:AAA family ATPase [Pseudoscardovia radai]OZG51209.1 AAA domain-containing protein [Pseudoscardovia radai]